MRQKRVLIIDDEKIQRNSLRQAFELRGFDVEAAGSAAEARELVARQQHSFDVAVLDMDLGDGEPTGADLAIEFRSRYWQQWPPEFLINSVHVKSDYLKLAFRLGAAAYLEKDEHAGLGKVAAYVRALALRRALSVERPDALDRIEKIAASSKNRAEAVHHFCRDILSRELASCLGAPFLLLITDDSHTHGWSATIPGLKGDQPEYTTIQALTYGESGTSAPLVIDQELLRGLDAHRDSLLLPKLKDAVFIPLTMDNKLRLSLGILPRLAGPAEDAYLLAETLAKYFQPAVLKHLLTLTATLAELHARQLTVLKTTSQFCLYLGQEQLTTLETAEDAGEVNEAGRYIRKMHSLSEDLTRAGAILGELAELQERGLAGENTGRKGQVVSMRETVSQAWERVARMLAPRRMDLLALGDGDCRVYGRPAYLEVATSRVLQWLVQRVPETPAEVEPEISVRFQDAEDGVKVIFEDRSRRLNDTLRRYLFVPLSQAVSRPPARDDLEGPGVHLPLYVAKTLVEFGNGGRLEDQSAEMDRLFGHRLVMSFPEVETASA